MKQSKLVFLFCIILSAASVFFAQSPKPKKVLPKRNTVVKNSQLEDALFEAVRNDKFEEAKKLIASGVNVNAVDETSGWRPLHFAVYSHQLEIVKLLLQKGARVNALDTDKSTPLNIIFSDNISLNTLEIIKALVAAGANVNLADDLNLTPLIRAAGEFDVDIEVIKFLLASGANPNAVSNDGKTPLQEAVTVARDDIADLLKPLTKNKKVKNIEKPTDENFVAACFEPNWRRIKKMIELGANVNAVNAAGKTPLHGAVLSSDLPMLKLLLENAAKTGIVDNDGLTLLHNAAESHGEQRNAVIQALIKLGEDPTAKTPNGETVLLILLENSPEDTESIKTLLNYKIDLAAKNLNGDTALLLAVNGKVDLAIIKLLIAKGSDPNQTDETGDTALQRAVFIESRDVAEFLTPLTKTIDKRAQLSGKFFQSDDVEIYYEIHGTGTGTPLFVLHGGPGFDHQYLLSTKSLDELGRNRPVIFYDQRGSGNSSRLTINQSASVGDMTHDLDNLRKHLGYQKIDILGHSWGGYLAMAYAIDFSENVSRLVVCDSMSPRYTQNTDVFESRYPKEFQEMKQSREGSRDYLVAYMKMLFYSKEKRDSFIKNSSAYTYNTFVSSQVFSSASLLNLSSSIGAFKFPVLIIHGRHDANIIPDVSLGIQREIPNSQLVIFEKSGHLPFYEEPEKFTQVVEDFLSGKKVFY